MIKDKLVNSSTYINISNNLKKGFEWLQATNLDTIKDGKYYIDGEKVFANIQTYETKDDAKYEAHRKYIDIQYMINGKELVGVTDISNCKTCIQYDTEKDLEFFDIVTKDEYLTLATGEFIILFPQDTHKPSIKFNEKSIVKKVVVKVLVD